MKRYLLYILITIAVSFTSIVLYAAVSSSLEERTIGRGDESKAWYYETTIDGCEYIVTDKTLSTEGVGIGITHKGNCKNAIHLKP